MWSEGRPMMISAMMMGNKSAMDCCGEQKGEVPWDMCRRMMDAVGRANDLASYATPELRQIFEEWLGQIEGEILQAVNESGQFVLFRLARQGKIDLSAGTARAK